MKKMKLLFLTLSFLTISSVILGQRYNPAIYDERGQYLSELAPAKQEYTEVELRVLTIGDKIYPQLMLQGYSTYDSGFGLIGFAEVNKIKTKGFAEKGYPIKSGLGIFVSAGLMYNFNPKKNNDYLFTGLSYYYGKQFWGPIFGFNLEDRKWHFFLMGHLALQGNVDKISGVEAGFDPNSWYKVQLTKKVNQNFSLGLYSERFYLSGLMLEYNIGEHLNKLNKLKLRAYFGQELEFGGTSFGLGFKICTLDKRYGKRY